MSNSQKILIDGYNVIHADPEMKRLLDPSPERARAKLIELVTAYVGRRRLNVTVVFDGKGTQLDTETIIPGKLQVLFSRGHQSADDLIITTLEDALNPREYLVVTSDNVHIGRNARRLGAQVLATPAFLSRLVRAAGQKPSADEKPEPDTDDIEYWLKKFSSE